MQKMGLKIIMKDGRARGSWYGRIVAGGKCKQTCLDVPIAGTIPTDADGKPNLSKRGDAAFERSRRQAEKAFKKWQTLSKKSKGEIEEKAHRARTGESAGGEPLSKLGELWDNLMRDKAPSPRWAQVAHTWFKRFEKFAGEYAQERGNVCEYVNDITPEIAKAWFADIRASHSWETVTKQTSLMRSMFRRCATSGRKNPFGDIIVRNHRAESASVPRVPLTEAQLVRLFEVTRNDPKIYPLVVCAASTGLRIGDVCHVRWDWIDLDAGFITMPTAKTGAEVTIPIFGRFREVLEDRRAVEADGSKPSPYVFPEAAAWYDRSRCVVSYALKPYLAEAGCVSAEARKAAEAFAVEVGADGAADATRPIAEAVEAAHFTDAKKARVLEVYRRFKSGERPVEIAAALRIARGQVSDYLGIAERLTGERLREKSGVRMGKPSKRDLAAMTRSKRKIGVNSACVYGWHSLRSTFIVLAVEAGVPLADVQKAVGHTTADMTLRYFRPTERHAAERVAKQMRKVGTILDTRLDGRTDAQALPLRVGADGEAPAALPLPTAQTAEARAEQIKALVANMSEADRALTRTLLGA